MTIRRRGSVRQKRPGAWFAYITVPDAAKPSGKRQVSRGPFANRRLCEEALTAMLAAADAHTLATDAGATMTVAAYGQRWLDDVATRLKPTTVNFYRDQFRWRISSSALGRTPLRDVNRAVIGRWLAEVRRVRKADGEPLAESTVHAAWRCLRALLSHAADHDVIPAVPSPSRSIATRPGPGRSRVEPWSDDQLRAWLAAVDAHDLGIFYRLLLATGMRRSEACGLRWSAVDLSSGVLRVKSTTVMVAGTPRQLTPKTDRSRRPVAVDADTLALLRAHRLTQRAHALAVGLVWSDEWTVVADAVGAPVSPDYLSKLMRRHCDDAGVPRRRVHDVRHLHASLLIEAGRDVVEVSRRLGHSSVATTGDLYGHLRDAATAAAADALGAHLARRLGTS